MKCQIKTLNSESELKEHFRNVADPKLLIECNDSNVNQFSLIKLPSFTIGLIDHSFGVPVQIGALDDSSTFLIGHESEISCVSGKSTKVLWTVKLDSVFFNFKKIQEEDLIVVVEEIGVLGLNFLGDKIWSLPTDIITDYQITDSIVIVKTMDEIELKITVRTGEILQEHHG